MRRYLIAGNWKMNGSSASSAALVDELRTGAAAMSAIEWLVCPPAPYLSGVADRLRGGSIGLGAQNLCEQAEPGAFTGEVHGRMLTDVGCRYVLVGHSERRALYGEDDARVAAKFAIAQACGLVPILCIGETLAERETDRTESVLARQLAAVIERTGIGAFANAVIAYEPVWAIGTGKVASVEQAQAAHAFVRGQLGSSDAKIAGLVRVLYGGSVKADNAAALFACADVDGGLIGGASLKAPDFLAIGAAAQRLAA